MNLWPRELRHRSAESHHFGGPWVRIQARTENVSVILFCADFYAFFLCICFVIPKGMLTNNVDPQKGGEANFTSVWKDLAHCAVCSILV